MGYTYNPLSGLFDSTGPLGASALYFGDPVANEAALPASGNPGEIRVVKDTDYIYIWDDGGSVWINTGIVDDADVSPTSKLYNRIHDTISVKDYGAEGDGSTDDTTAIEDAIAAAIAAGHNSVYFPPGEYRVTSDITIGSGIVLYGPKSQGTASQFGATIHHDSNGNLFTWDGSVSFVSGTGGGIRDMGLYKAAGKAGGVAITLSGADDNHRCGETWFQNVFISGISGATWSKGFYVDGTALTTAGTRGVRTTHFHKFRVVNCTSTDQYIHFNQATHVFGDFQISEGGGSSPAGVTIEGYWDDIQLNGVAVEGNVVISHTGIADSYKPTLTMTGLVSGTFTNSYSLLYGSALLSGDTTLSNSSTHFHVVAPSGITANNLTLTGTLDTSLTNRGPVLSSATGVISSVALTDGQLLIGSTGSDPSAASLTGGTGITTTPAAGGITITNSMVLSTDKGPSTYTSSNDAPTNESITGLSFSTSTVRAFRADVSVTVDATADLFAKYTLEGVYNGTSWTLGQEYVGDDTLVTFSITNAGQVQYSKTTTSGFSSTKFTFRAITHGI